MELPLVLDQTPEGKLIERREIGEPGYIENIEYKLNIRFQDDKIILYYYGEDGNEMSAEEVFLMYEFEIAG